MVIKVNSKISIIIPIYNCAGFLSRSIESVLNQNLSEFLATADIVVIPQKKLHPLVKLQ